MKSRKAGFTLIEMLVVAAVAAVLMGVALTAGNMWLHDANRAKLVAEQSREMYMLSKAVEQYMQANARNWTLDQRQVIGIDTLITATFLPQQFARRTDVAGVVANGVSPFGARYNAAAIAAMLSGKRVSRGVVWETGTPIAWGRYARVGLGQGSEPTNGSGSTSKINVLKQEIARNLNADQKHPAPAVANVTGTSVRGVSNGWVQDVAPYLGTSVTFVVPSVVILAGWPEFGSVLPPIDQTNNFGTCTVYPADCGTGGDLCLYPSSVPRSGICPVGQIEVKRFPHCGSVGTIVSVPEVGSSLSYGQETRVLSEDPVEAPDVGGCINERPGNAQWEENCNSLAASINSSEAADVGSYGKVIVNDTRMAFYQCQATTYQYTTGITRPSVYGPVTKEGPRNTTDVLCCLPAN